jgi:HPt (histidine-containing phosphotransfer) domain-containing protein
MTVVAAQAGPAAAFERHPLPIMLATVLALVFVGELVIMLVLPMIVPPQANEWVGSLLHAGLLSLWLAATLTPLGLHCRKSWVSSQVSEQRLLHQRLLDANNAAEAASQAKSHFLATMSHEIRMPLNGVLGTNELFDGVEKSEEAAQRSAATAATAAGPAAISRRTLAALRELDDEGSDLVAELVQTFVSSAPVDLAHMETALAYGNTKAVSQLSHALKSSAANLGADALSRCYAELERCGREGLIEDARARLPRTRAEQQRALQQLQAVLAEVPACTP